MRGAPVGEPGPHPASERLQNSTLERPARHSEKRQHASRTRWYRFMLGESPESSKAENNLLIHVSGELISNWKSSRQLKCRQSLDQASSALNRFHLPPWRGKVDLCSWWKLDQQCGTFKYSKHPPINRTCWSCLAPWNCAFNRHSDSITVTFLSFMRGRVFSFFVKLISNVRKFSYPNHFYMEGLHSIFVSGGVSDSASDVVGLKSIPLPFSTRAFTWFLSVAHA